MAAVYGAYRAMSCHRWTLARQVLPDPTGAAYTGAPSVAGTPASACGVVPVPASTVAVIEGQAPPTGPAVITPLPFSASPSGRARETSAVRAVPLGPTNQAVCQAAVRATAFPVPGLQADEEGKPSELASTGPRVAGDVTGATANAGPAILTAIAGPAPLAAVQLLVAEASLVPAVRKAVVSRHQVAVRVALARPDCRYRVVTGKAYLHQGQP